MFAGVMFQQNLQYVIENVIARCLNVLTHSSILFQALNGRWLIILMQYSTVC